MTVYYNDNDPYAANWLRNLIRAGHIAHGVVDDRSIVDVHASDLTGFTHCHFFAGIGGWPVALQLAGWHATRPVWTGSCPCQPFSDIGEGKAANDERHLWPAWFSLIAECRPATIFGEQVEAAIGWGWLDVVFNDLEAAGYACGATVLPACSIGAPHIRNRIWFVADAGARGCAIVSPPQLHAQGQSGHDAARRGEARLLADAHREQRDRRRRSVVGRRQEPADDRELGNTKRSRLEGHAGDVDYPRGRSFALGSTAASGATRGFWQGAEVVSCRDQKLRPVEPGTFPLAHGVPDRVGRLRAYGNAIVPQLAAEFVTCCM